MVSSLLLLLGYSCQRKSTDKLANLVKEWSNKEIKFDERYIFTQVGKDSIFMSIPTSKYKILNYTDSLGCVGCNLRLPQWKEWIQQIKSNSDNDVSFLFFIHPKSVTDLVLILEKYHFNIPICIDIDNSLNKQNNFSTNLMFQTFLLDKDNKVLAIGNPIHNPKIKELYLNIIKGKNREISVGNKLLTTVTISTTQLGMGTFSWEEMQSKEFILTNTGKNSLVIEGVSTSCGCVTVDYTKEPIPVGKDAVIKVNYKAEQPEYFNKTITVYCNAKESPFRIKVTGNAK